MQNIPGIALEQEEQMTVLKISAAKKSDQQELFADLFNEHADMVENELALAPVSSQDKMVESAPVAANSGETAAASASGSVAGSSAKDAAKAAAKEESETTTVQDNEARITEEEFEDVREDLEAYGMTDEEIDKIEEQVKSEEGMTWGQLVTRIAQEMSDLRTAQFTDEQKVDLKDFFSKFGFSEKEGDKLIAQLEKGNFDKVMKELQAKVEAMPQDKQLLFEKKEIEAFTAALSFSKEFTSKVKELLGNNALPKDVKQAFTLIRQEMAAMDKKDQELVKAVGTAFAKAMGDESKATTAARQIAEAVDLKPRVAEKDIEAEVKEDLAQAVKVRKDVMPENSTRKTAEESLTSKTEIKGDAKSETSTDKQDGEAESEGEDWDHMFNKMRDDSAPGTKVQGRAENTAASTLTKTGVTEVGDAKTKATAWEKVSAPKVMKQVDNAVLRTLNNGTKQLTLQLTPENLGKLSIVLQVSGKEVGATIRAENADAAKIIHDNLDIIKNSLESQGLKVEKLDVQTGLTGDQDYNDWFGENEHNLAREREALIAMRNHMKQMREENGDTLAQELQHIGEQAIHADQGLHIIA